MSFLNSLGITYDPQPEEKSSLLRRVAGDTAITGLKGVIGVPEAAVGIADIPTGGRAGKALETIGYRPALAKEILSDLYSPEQKEAFASVAKADGFIPTIGALAENPSVALHSVVESAPSMLGGAGVARGAMKIAPRLTPWLAGAVGEGAVSAGQAAEQIRGENQDKLLDPRQAGLAALTGVGTGAIGAAAGKLANSAIGKKLGIADIDTMLASGARADVAKESGILKQIAASGFSEGVLEELPQSMQEQVLQNLATGKPWNEGVGAAGAQGLVAGGLMGAAGGGYNALANNLASKYESEVNSDNAGFADPAHDTNPTNQTEASAPTFSNLPETEEDIPDFSGSSIARDSTPNAPPLALEPIDAATGTKNPLASALLAGINPYRQLAEMQTIPRTMPQGAGVNPTEAATQQRLAAQRQRLEDVRRWRDEVVAARGERSLEFSQARKDDPSGRNLLDEYLKQHKPEEYAIKRKVEQQRVEERNAAYRAKEAADKAANTSFLNSLYNDNPPQDSQPDTDMADTGIPPASVSQTAAVDTAQQQVAASVDDTPLPLSSTDAGLNSQQAKVVKPRQPKKVYVNPVKDDLITAVAKLGGIDSQQAKSEWGNTIADSFRDLNKHATVNGGAGFIHAFKKGGRPIDDIFQALQEEGYLSAEADHNDLLDKIHGAAAGQPSYSNQFDYGDQQQDYDGYPFDMSDIAEPPAGGGIRKTARAARGAKAKARVAMDDKQLSRIEQEVAAMSADDMAALFDDVAGSAAAPATEVLHRFDNEEEGTAAEVAKIEGGYSVGLRDTESGQMVPSLKVFKSEEDALRFANNLVQPQPPATIETTATETPALSATEPQNTGTQSRQAVEQKFNELLQEVKAGNLTSDTAFKQLYAMPEYKQLSLEAQQQDDGSLVGISGNDEDNIYQAFVDAATKRPAEQKQGAIVTHNADRNGIELKFPGRPDNEAIARMKAAGFRWSGKQKLWYARSTPERQELANELAGDQKPASDISQQPSENIDAPPVFDARLGDRHKNIGKMAFFDGKPRQAPFDVLNAGYSAEWYQGWDRGKAEQQAKNISDRSAADIIKAAASSGVKGADEALKGLYELFGGKSLKSFPGNIDEDTYRAAKPHFDAVLENFRAAGKSLKEFFTFLIDQFGAGIQPYVMKFMQEKQQESGILKVTETEVTSDDNTRDGGTGTGTYQGGKPGALQAAEEERGAGQGDGSIRTTDIDGNENPDEGGNVGTGSVGSEPSSVRVQTGEGAERTTGLLSEPVVDLPGEPRTLKLKGDNPGNYRITAADNLGAGTPGQKIANNLAAIRLIKQLEADGRYPTREEQAVLAKYVGWGGLKSVFDPNSKKPQEQKARQELEQLLTKNEYFEARQSVLNAHYTSSEIIGSIYKVVQHMGFNGGHVLEPTYGSGNFIGLMPEGVAASSKWYGSELDPITSRIGKYLYPDAQLIESGFQAAEFPYGKFDLAIGNPPFGSETITDTNKKRSEIDGFKIHNYVIAKSGMHLRPGGVMAMVVTSRFMDTANPEARDYLAQHFKFLTAIRLPNDAFAKNAGTEVTTDLVFFQKLMPGETNEGKTQHWLRNRYEITNELGEDVTLNAWFAKHPELMLGIPSMKGTMYGGQWRQDESKGEFTLNARPGQDTAAEIEKLLASDDFIRLKDVFTPTTAQAEAAATSIQMNREDIGIGGYVRENGKLFMREDDDANGNPVFVELTVDTPWTEKQTLGETRLARINGMMDLRELAYKLIEAERFDLPGMEELRTRLNSNYDAFVKKYGFLSDPVNASLMADDVKIESGLEVGYRKAISAAKAKSMGGKPAPAKADKAAILTQRVYFPVKEITSAANARDGYGISLSERGRLDLDYIAGLLKKERSEVIEELAEEGLIFRDPETGEYIQEDAYLSGNVKAKLRKVQGREGYEKNAEALEKVLPKDVATEEIFTDLGATWIPAKVYEEFAELMGVRNPQVVVIPETGTVRVVGGSVTQNDMNVMLQNPDHDVVSLINHIAQKKAVVAYDRTGDDKLVVNKERTKALVPMVKRVSATFRDWIMADPLRARELTKLYNDTMNTHAPRVYNGNQLKTVGASPAVRLRNSQRNAAWRMIQSPVVLLDHVVGAGKTFTVITGVMERKRLGLSNKSMIVVPNHLVGQWAADFLKLYPGARILAAGKKDFEKKNRRRLFARIATGNFDAIIVGHSSFGFIPMEPDTVKGFIEEEISYLERALIQAEHSKDRRLVRNITERIAKKRERIARLLNGTRDDVVTFENMGIDNLVVDESHEFKNLEYSTAMQNITGMGSPQGAKKSFDLYSKIQYLRQQDGSITFATGTPISNSLVEMYTILRYLNREGLKERNLDVFDAWAMTYASVESRIEYTASQKLKDRQVMATFNNLPEMLQLYNEFADVISMKELKRIYAEQIRESNQRTGANEREEFPVPNVKNGGRYLDIADPTSSQREYMDYLVARANRLEKLGSKNDPREDNHLWLMNDARKMALDIRLVDPSAAPDPNNKINRAANNIKRIYDAWDKDKGTQLVFCDLSTPAGTSKSAAATFIKNASAVLGLEKDKNLARVLSDLTYFEQWTYLKNRLEREIEKLNDGPETDANEAAREKIEKFLEAVADDDVAALNTADTGFSVYDDLKAVLIGKGIPANEIKFIHEANTDPQKQELFGMVNAGQVRVLIGSSRKMGAGTNAQERLVALHHMDAPWRPSDVEQREGRIIRQGNMLYERDPEGFEIEIPAYSTRNTFDAVMWQVLARKAEMLEDFRSGARSMQDAESDSASYAEFMAESTGNPIFREKFKLEREIEELESTERNIMARRSAGERLVKNADKDIARAEKDLQNAKRDLDEITEDAKFTVDGKQYADDLTDAYKTALHEYNAAFKEYETKLLPEYVAAKEAVESLPDDEKKAALKALKKPVQPVKPTLQRLEKTSEAARAALRVSELLDDIAERGEVEFAFGGAQIVIKKVVSGKDQFDFTTYINGQSYWRLSADNLKHMSQQKLMDIFRTGEIHSRVAQQVFAAQRYLDDVHNSIKDAKQTLSKLVFADKDKLTAMQERYKAVVEEVNALEKQLDEKREKESNRYIDGDSVRFGSADAQYSLSSQPGTIKGMQAEELRKEFAANPLKSKIVVVQTVEELPDGKKAGDRAASREKGAIEGMYHNGTIYLVADSLPDVERARIVALRHELTHAGQGRKITGIAEQWFREAMKRGETGTDFQQDAMKILRVEAIKRGYKLDNPEDFTKAVQEATAVLAEAMQPGQRNGLFNRLIMYLRHYLRKIGVSIRFTDKELVDTVAEMMRQGERNLMDGRGPEGGGLSVVPSVATPEENQYSLRSPQDAAREKQLADHLQKMNLGDKTAALTRSFFDLIDSALPPKLKANIGKILSNPWFGSEGNIIRRAIVNLNLVRSHVRNAMIHDLMVKSDGYTGTEGLDNILKTASPEEVKAWNALIKKGDVEGKAYTTDELKKDGYSQRVIEAYHAFHEVIGATNRVRFEKLKEIALLPYKDEPWFKELTDLLEFRHDLERDLAPHQVGILNKLTSSMKALDKAVLKTDKNPTGKPVDNAVIAAYLKYLDKLNATSDPPLVKAAFKHITEYRGRIDEIRNEWGQVRGYAPRNRKDGDWHVSVYRVDDDGRTKVFMQPVIAEILAQRLSGKISADMKGYLKGNFDAAATYEVEYARNTATPAELMNDKGRELAIETLLDNAFDKAEIFKTKGVDVEAAKRAVLAELTKEIMAQGFSRHGISREPNLIEGYQDEDYQTVLKEFISGQSGWLSKMQYAVEVTREADRIAQANPDDKVWVHSYYKDSMKNATYMDEVAATARSIGAVWYLGFKASSAILNAFQNYTVGQAELSRLMKLAGKKGEAVFLLAKAQKDVLRDKMTAEEKAVLDQAIRQGTLHAQAIRAMSGLQEQGYGGKWKKFAETAMTPFSWVEQRVNREPAFLAAYRVFKTTPADQFDQAAFDKAEEFVNSTHYVMGNENLPELVRMLGPVGKTAYLFQGYVHNYLLWLAKRGRNGEFAAIARSFGAIAALGGLFALPGADDMDKWIEKWFGVSYKQQFKQFVKKNLRQYGTPGELLEGFINNGLPSVFGVNMSRAVAVNIPFVSDTDKSFGERIGGVWGGIAKKPGMALSAAGSGEYLRALENLAPEFIANPMRAYRQYTDGATTLRGKPVFDETGRQMKYSGLDVAKKALGFQPLEISNQTELKGHERGLQAFWKDERDDVLAKVRKAKDSEEMKAAMVSAMRYNKRLRESQAAGLVSPISMDSIKRSRTYKPDKKKLAWEQQRTV